MEDTVPINTREDAIRRLHEQGFYAKARDWSFGESVIAGTSLHLAGDDGSIQVIQHALCIFPDEGQWSITEFSMARESARRCGSLADAVRAAAVLLAERDARDGTETP